MEGPAQRAAAHIEGAHVAGRSIRPERVGDRGTDDDQITNYGAGRGRVELPRVVDRRDAGEEVHRALPAEGGARLAGRRVERDQARVERCEEHARSAGAFCVRVPPIRDTAVDPHVRVGAPALESRIESPQLAAGFWVERDHPVARRREEHPPIDDDRRRFECAAAILLEREAALEEVAVAVTPGDSQLLHVLARDVRERREAAAAGRAFRNSPIRGWRRGRGELREECLTHQGDCNSSNQNSRHFHGRSPCRARETNSMAAASANSSLTTAAFGAGSQCRCTAQ